MVKQRRRISAAMKHSKAILEHGLVGLKEKDRPKCTGPEAKAALALRVEVMDYALLVVLSAIVIQRNVRRYLLSKKWRELLHRRFEAVNLLLRVTRRYIAYRLCSRLRAQQTAEWEQLWDSKRNLLYYYNRYTGKATWEEPSGVPIRPLVRDKFSAQLIQAWPHIAGSSVETSSIADGSWLPSHAICGKCKVRKCVRLCLGCWDEVDGDPTKAYNYPYCFPCFAQEHSSDLDNGKSDHTYTLVNQTNTQIPVAPTEDSVNPDVVVSDPTPAAEKPPSQYLICSVCRTSPAERKCMGILNDAQIDEICSNLKRSPPDKWKDILSAANVGGERKLTLMLEQIGAAATEVKKEVSAEDTVPGSSVVSQALISSILSHTQLQSIRQLLERIRAECDECYCAQCYMDTHAAGKRVLHRWRGFKQYSPVCSVCDNAAAEMKCRECDSMYCPTCFKVFHSMGRKKRHTMDMIVEPLEAGEILCSECHRRAGVVPCGNERCNAIACESCYMFEHKAECDKRTAYLAGSNRPSSSSSRRNMAALLDLPVCVACGEGADRKCQQCGDAYCSRVWMGNPGCFLQFHSKGNRANHFLVALPKTRTTLSRGDNSSVGAVVATTAGDSGFA